MIYVIGGSAMQRSAARGSIHLGSLFHPFHLQSDPVRESHYPAIAVHRNGTILHVNRHFADASGYAASEIEGRSVWTSFVDIQSTTGTEGLLPRCTNYDSQPYTFYDFSFISRNRNPERAIIEVRPIRGGEQYLLVFKISNARSERIQASHDEPQVKKAESFIDSLSQMISFRDPGTALHEKRVSTLSSAIADELHLSGHVCEGIRAAALVHDIGKIHIPGDILSKPAALNAAERELVQGHARAGYEIVRHIQFPWPVAEAIYQHHERLDGSGYPRGLSGGAISIEARVLAVADAAEALCSARPHRAAYQPEDAIEILVRDGGTKYDSNVIDACVITLLKDDGSFFGTNE
jgi:putative nucleotidyltransferase with HDIG domain/PAS domain S-box-containing protein